MPTAADIFERHHRPVFSFLRRLTVSSEDAEDLTQEVFVRVLRAIEGYRERSLERAWVFRIVRNVWLDHNRARGRAPVVEPVHDGHVARFPDPPDGRLALQQALARLGEALTGAVIAQDDSAPAPGREKARLSLGLLETWEGKATRRLFTLGPLDVAAGERVPDRRLPEIAFALEREGDDCEGSMTFESAETLLETHALVWTASFDVLSASTDRIELRGSWRRLGKGESGRPEELAADPDARLTLREGDRVLLDFARSPDPRCARSFALELSAGLAEDPALAREQVGYEMWLVHEGPGADKRRDYLRLTATQGQELTFEFPHVWVPAGPGSHETATQLQVDVSGGVRGRIRPDGSLDLSLESRRTLWYVAPEGGGEHVGDGGEKLLNVQPGEVIRVELPGPSRNTQRPERYARDLEGHSFALILRAKVVS